MKGEFEMTIVDRFEEMGLIEKTFIGVIGGVLMIVGGMVALTLLLVIFKVAIGGIC